MISRLRDELRKWAVPAAILMLAAIDAVAHSALARSDSLFEPWKTVPSSTERIGTHHVMLVAAGP